MWLDPTHCGGTTLRLVVLSAIRKQAKKEQSNKKHSSLASALTPPFGFLSWSPWMKYCSMDLSSSIWLLSWCFITEIDTLTETVALVGLLINYSFLYNVGWLLDFGVDMIGSFPVQGINSSPNSFFVHLLFSWNLFFLFLYTCVKLTFSSPMYRIILRVFCNVSLADMLYMSGNILISPFILVDTFAW